MMSDDTKSNLEYRATFAIQGIGAGLLEWNIPTGEMQFSDRWLEISGYSRNDVKPRLEFLTALVHPDELALALSDIQEVLGGRKSVHAIEHRLRHKQGHWIWVESRSKIAEWSEHGEPQCMIGTHRDITARKEAEEALRQSEERFRNALDVLLEGCMILGFDWTYLYLNETSARHGLNTRENLLGRSILEMYPGVENSTVFAHYRACMEQRIPQRFEESYTFANGRKIWYEFSVQPIPEGIIVLSLDISARKQAEIELRIAAVAFESQEGTMITDASCVILKVNRAFTETTGYSDEEAVGQTPRILKSGRHDEAFYRAMWEIIAHTGGWQGEIWDRRKNGEEYPKWLSISAVKNEQGIVSHYVGTHFDISKQQRSEAAIEKLNEDLEWLAAERTDQLEAERTRIARELHDQLGQMLTALKMDVARLSGHLAQDDSEAAQKTADMARLIDDTLDAVRSIAAGLRPVMLDDLGLRAALEWLLEDFGKRSDISYELETELDEYSLDDDRATAAFRIVQECLTNVVRHAQANHVVVRIGYRNDELQLSVQDDGKGIAAPADRRRNSFGLIGIRERAAHFGGSITISNALGAGALIEVRLPRTQDRRGKPP